MRENMITYMYRKEDSLIFGIGDEVIVLTTVFMATILSLLYFLRFRNSYRRFAEMMRRVFQEPRSDPPRSASDMQLQNGPQVQNRAHPEDVCPICLGGYSYKLETNCGHTFCGPCMKTYLQHDEFIVQTMFCPLCRQPLTLLFNCYTDEERRADPESEMGSQRVEMNILINRFNRLAAATPKTLLQNVCDWPVLIRRLFVELFSERPLVLFHVRVIVFILFGSLYVASPFDVIPEAFYGIIGFIDDLIVIFLCIWYMVNMYRTFLASREGGLE